MLHSLRQRLTSSAYRRDVFLQSAGNSLAQLIGILAMPLITRIYGPDHFAAFNLFKELVAGAAILMTLRLEYLVMLPLARERADDLVRVVARLATVHLLVFTPVLYMVAGWTAMPPALQPVSGWLWAVPLTALALSWSVAWQQRIQRLGDFGASAASEVAGRTSYVASCLVGGLALPSGAGLMLSLGAGAFGKSLWLMRTKSSSPMDGWGPPREPVDPAINRLAVSTSVSQLISLCGSAMPMLYIADAYGTSALGQYALVISTLYLPSSVVGTAIGQVFYQRAAQSHGEGRDFFPLYWTTSTNALRIAVPLFAFVALLSPTAYPIVFGSDWVQAGEVARIMALAAAIGFVSTALDKSSLVVNAWWYLTAWHLLRSVMVLVTILVARRLGLDFESFVTWLAVASAAAYAIDWMFSGLFSKRWTSDARSAVERER